VIRATDYPAAPPGRGRPDSPEHPAGPPGRADAAPPPRPAPPTNPAPVDPDVYVYRDTSEPDVASATPDPAESDAAYWYDLLAEEPAPLHEPARGPFEPLLPSSGPPPGAAEPPAADPAPAPADAISEEGAQDTEHARARKLEQIKDLYLTAEAIGEHNVDKHFDQLLAQQRELISDYFRQSTAAKPGEPGEPEIAGPETAGPETAGPETAGPEPAAPGPAVASPRDGLDDESGAGLLDPRDPGTPRGRGPGTPEDAACAAEPPRGW
jgi:hypothetical protein